MGAATCVHTELLRRWAEYLYAVASSHLAKDGWVLLLHLGQACHLVKHALYSGRCDEQQQLEVITRQSRERVRHAAGRQDKASGSPSISVSPT